MYILEKCKDFQVFDSLIDMVNVADSHMAENGCSAADGYSPEFYGDAESYEDASMLIREGWPEGVAKLECALSEIRDGLDSLEVREPELDICGPIAIVGEYLAGNPECMLNPCNSDEKPVVNFLVDTGIRGSGEAHHAINRGAAILGLIEAVQASGREVAIYGSSISSDGGVWQCQITCMKQAGQEFNLHTMAYVLAHPSYHRRHSFAVRDAACGWIGSSRSTTEVEGISATIGDIDCYFPCISDVLDRHWNSAETASDYVVAIGREAGLIN